MKRLEQWTYPLAKGLELLHWGGAILMLVLLGMSVFAQTGLAGLLAQSGMVRFNVYGFELDGLGVPGIPVFRVFLSGALLIFILMAMVFRNVCLILRTADGKTWFSEGSTPFQMQITRMVREIGIFYLAIPVVGLLTSTVLRLISPIGEVELSVNLGGVVTGLLILCLSRVFAYGTGLQSDVDGLV